MSYLSIISLLGGYLILVGRKRGYQNTHTSPLYSSVCQTINILKSSPGDLNAEKTDSSSINSSDRTRLYVGTKAELPTWTSQRFMAAAEAPIAVAQEHGDLLWTNSFQNQTLGTELSSSGQIQEEMRYPAVELPGIVPAAELSSSSPASERSYRMSTAELSTSGFLNTAHRR
jgi:hypothetical protein